MSSRPGCFRPFLFGCLGLLGLGILLLLVGLMMAWRGVQQREVVDQTAAISAADAAPVLTARTPGRVILEFGRGEFYVRPAEPGAGVSVQARFDRASHVLTDSLEVLPDSTWVYHVQYRATVPMLRAMLQALIGGDTESRVEVFLPPDLPIALEVVMEQGGAEIDLGGLWLTGADLRFHQGGAEVDISSPLREPLGELRLTSSMGGVEATRLGNASPRILLVSTRMGGGAIDLGGAWAGDCRARFAVEMGGLAVMGAEGLQMQPASRRPEALGGEAAEVPLPTLWYDVEARMGEVDITPR